MRILSSGMTDVGMERQGNEDSFACDDTLGLYLVADGMGGHAAGEIASQTAVRSIRQEILARYRERQEQKANADSTDPGPEQDLNLFEYSVQTANRKIVELSQQNPDYNGMGTTVSGLLVTDDGAQVAHVGDSRIYRLRDGKMELLTNDHSWVNEQLQRNVITEEEARNHRWKNVITRALGNRAELEVDTDRIKLQVGDSYLLCSDGLTGMVEDQTIQRYLEESPEDPELACRRLVDLANDNGGKDNVTIIILHIVS